MPELDSWISILTFLSGDFVLLTAFLLFLFVFVSGWFKKRRQCLLLCACIISLLWLFFFFYYNVRTISVSRKNLHQFHTSKKSHGDTEVERHQYHFSINNDSLKFIQDRHNVTDHAKESRHTIQTDGLLHTAILPTVRVLPTKVSKNDTFHNSNPTHNLIPGWLRSDPSVQQLLDGQNNSLSSLKPKSSDDAWITSRPVWTPAKPLSMPLLASGDKPSGLFDQDIRHLADKDNLAVLSVVDSGYINFAINFQQLSVDRVGLKNFMFVCTDQQAVEALRHQGIACSYFHTSVAVQVVQLLYLFIYYIIIVHCLQCFDAVDWASGRAPGL